MCKLNLFLSKKIGLIFNIKILIEKNFQDRERSDR